MGLTLNNPRMSSAAKKKAKKKTASKSTQPPADDPADDPAEAPAEEPATTRSPLPQHRFNFAKHDPLHCSIPGLFRSTFRSDMPAGRNHLIRHKRGDITIEVRCSDPLRVIDLRVIDLRVLQGLAALGSPLAEPEVLTDSSTRTQLRENLFLSQQSQTLPSLVVSGTYYELAREIGLPPHSGSTFRAIRASIERMWNVSIVTDQGGKRHGYRMLSFCRPATQTPLIEVALNPLITAAILGKSINASGGYTRIEMAEVRKPFLTGATRILHQYLSCLIAQGEFKDLIASNLCAHIWPTDKAAKGEERSRINKQNARLKRVMDDLNELGWNCTLIAAQPKNAAQPAYRKWRIARPAKPIEDSPEFTRTRSTGTAPLKSPAIALRNPDNLDETVFAECVRLQPTAALRECLARLSDEQLAACAQAVPAAALRYAPNRLADWQIDDCARAAPLAAIKFAAAKLSPARFVACLAETESPPPGATAGQLDAWLLAEPARAWNYTAVQHAPNTPPAESLRNAREWLTPEQFAVVVIAMPAEALQFASSLLSPAQIDDCALAAPAEALHFTAAKLTPLRFVACIKETGMTPAGAVAPDQLAAWADDNLTAVYDYIGSMQAFEARLPGHFAKIVSHQPSAALTGAATLLTAEQLAACASRCPAVALRHAAALLQPATLANCVAAEPAYALAYAGEILPQELLQQAIAAIEVRSNTRAALDSLVVSTPSAAARIASKLTAAHIGYCIENAPEAMLKHAYDFLTLSQIAYCNSRVT